MEEKVLRSKEKLIEEDGKKIVIVREFENLGSSILEQIISFLYDKMEQNTIETNV